MSFKESAYTVSNFTLKLLGCLALISVMLVSCVKIDTPPALEVKVLDQYNDVVAGARVSLYTSLEEWSMLENPVQVWKNTDQNGKVTFLNLQEVFYYVYVEKDTLNNIKEEIVTHQKLKVNIISTLEVHVN